MGGRQLTVTLSSWATAFAARSAVKGFVAYVLTTGQAEAAKVNYAKLPADLAAKAVAQLDKVTVS